MSSTTISEKPKPKQLRPFTLVVTLIELGLALWALTALRRHWLAADGPLPAPFWGAAAAALGFTTGLVLTNVVGILQTLGSLNRPRPLGSRLPIRLTAVEDPYREIISGLMPLILACGLPVYPLLRLAWLNWLDLNLLWIGFALGGSILALGCSYIIGRQIYLILIGRQTAVEVSHETISPGQALAVKMVCHQTVRHRTGNKGHRYVTTTLHEETLGTYDTATISLLHAKRGSPPVTTTIPADAYSSTDPDDYPTIEWRVEVMVKVAHAPDFRLTFPFKVTEESLPNQGYIQ